jgi:prenyltransferase beta subunit
MPWLACLMLLPCVVPLEIHDPEAVAFLRTLQTPAGGFATLPASPGQEAVPSLRTTRTALRTFRLLGGQPADRDAVIRFLHACYDSTSGGFCDRPGQPPDPISTAVGLMILGELRLPTEAYLESGLKFMDSHTEDFEQIRMVASALEEFQCRVPAAEKWLTIVEKARNTDGSYGMGPGQARTTALHVITKIRLGGEIESPASVLKILQEGQRPDGGFGGETAGDSDLEACYRIVRVIARLDGRPADSEKLTAFLTNCRHEDGGYGIRPRLPSSLHGTYYATIVRHWLAGGK